MSATTAFGRVAQAIVTALLASPAVAGGNVKANPARAWGRNVSQAVAVRLLNASRADGTNCGEMWDLVLQIDCEARALTTATVADPAEAVDALLSTVAARVAAADLSAVGVVDRLPQSVVVWEIDAAETPAALASYRLSLRLSVADALTATA